MLYSVSGSRKRAIRHHIWRLYIEGWGLWLQLVGHDERVTDSNNRLPFPVCCGTHPAHLKELCISHSKKQR